MRISDWSSDVCSSDLAPLQALMRLQERYNLFLYIDDAHGISILGAQGEGFARGQLPDELGPRTIVAASLGNGFGASGGFLIPGSREQVVLVLRSALPYPSRNTLFSGKSFSLRFSLV